MTDWYVEAGATGGTGTQIAPFGTLSELHAHWSDNDKAYLSGRLRETLSPKNGTVVDQWPGKPDAIIDGSDVFDTWVGPDANGEYYTDASDDPKVVFYDDVKLTEGTVGSLASGEWGWDSANSRIYIKDDPTGHTVEAGVRYQCVNVRQYGATVRNIQARRGRIYNFNAEPWNGYTISFIETKSVDCGTYGYMLYCHGLDYCGNIIAKNCEDSGSYISYRTPYCVDGSVVVENCNFTSRANTTIWIQQNTGGKITIRNVTINNYISIDSNSGCYVEVDRLVSNSPANFGIYVKDQSGGYINIKQGSVKNSSFYGVYVTNMSAGTCIVDGVDVEGAGSYGIYCTNVTGGNLQVVRNKVHGGADDGIRLNIDGSAATNIIAFNVSAGNDHHGITLSGGNGYNVYRNTVGSEALGYYGIRVYNNSGVNSTIRGNVMTGERAFYYTSGDSTSGLDEDNNCVHSPMDSKWIDGITYTDLASWQSATGQDAHSISADPRFKDASSGDYQLAENSPCIDAGCLIDGAPEKDANYMDAIMGPKPDMGAYEFNPYPFGAHSASASSLMRGVYKRSRPDYDPDADAHKMIQRIRRK